jgi:hypothetical protein
MNMVMSKRPFGDYSDVRSPTSTSSDVRSPTSTSTEVRSPTSTSTEVRSPTSTSTEVRSPTSTSTDAYTQGNITVTGGAGAGAYTTVNVYRMPQGAVPRVDGQQYMARSAGVADRMQRMIDATSASRVPGVMPDLMAATGADRASPPIYDIMANKKRNIGIGIGLLSVAALGLGLHATLKKHR